MPIELVSAVESSRLLQERLLGQRLERGRAEEAVRERQRLEEGRLAQAQADAAFAERAQLDGVQQRRLENARLAAERFEDARAARVQSDPLAADREVERLLAERTRSDGLQSYRAQSEPPPRPYVLDAEQAERVQTARQAIERAEATRLDRIDFSDAALSQVQYGY